MKQLDIEKCRSVANYTKRELAMRVLWGFGKWFFRCSPRIAFGYRAAILRLFGARIGRKVMIYPTAFVYYPWLLEIDDNASVGEWALIYNLGPIKIGARSTISQRVHLCAGTHDYTDPILPLIRPPIVIGEDVWVCADSFVGPDRKIGDGAVIGACSVVTRDVAPWTVVAGNPAKFIKERVLQS